MLFWNPRTNGCGPACPANLLLVHSSGAAVQHGRHSGLDRRHRPDRGIVALIAWHWRSARGYARRAMTSLVWVALPIGAYITILQIPSNLGLSSLVTQGIGPLILIAAPAAYAIGMVRARSARRAVGAALVSLEPGPPPGQAPRRAGRRPGRPGPPAGLPGAGPAAITGTPAIRPSTPRGCPPGGC